MSSLALFLFSVLTLFWVGTTIGILRCARRIIRAETAIRKLFHAWERTLFSCASCGRVMFTTDAAGVELTARSGFEPEYRRYCPACQAQRIQARKKEDDA